MPKKKKKKCSECGNDLIPSKYAKDKKEGEAAKQHEQDLVCSDSKCPDGEK